MHVGDFFGCANPHRRPKGRIAPRRKIFIEAHDGEVYTDKHGIPLVGEMQRVYSLDISRALGRRKKKLGDFVKKSMYLWPFLLGG